VLEDAPQQQEVRLVVVDGKDSQLLQLLEF
jgi:hypothetical protein